MSGKWWVGVKVTRADAIRSLFQQAMLAKEAELKAAMAAQEEEEPVEADLLAQLAARKETEINEVT